MTPLEEKIDVPGTTVHIFYALKMGEKYEARYHRHFKDPDIRRHDMQHEELLVRDPEQWAAEVRRCCGNGGIKMKVLVYGAGVIGCYLTHVLCEAGNDVTLLARGDWKAVLETKGLTIRHHLQRRTTTDHPHIIGQVDVSQHYDVVFSVMQHQQMTQILDVLAVANSPLLVLVGNNMSAPQMEARIQAHTVTPKTILFGFQGTGGRRENGKVVGVRLVAAP